MNYEQLGWDKQQPSELEMYNETGHIPARIRRVERGVFFAVTPEREYEAVLSGSLRHLSADERDFAVVGDWVLLDPQDHGMSVIEKILPRRSFIARKEAGESSRVQPVAANVDLLFILLPMAENFTPRRIERYLLLALESKIQPVIVLTKSDMTDNKAGFIGQAMSVSAGNPVIGISSRTGSGLSDLSCYLQSGTTVALVGPSGAGKSSLINALLGKPLQKEGEIRESDGRGRHTTTSREFFILPEGAMVIDNPGMRELALLADTDIVNSGFDDIDLLSQTCRFKDCRHDSEPGCAVLRAVRTGKLDPGRLAAFRKLMKEARFIASRTDARIREQEKQKIKQIGKMRRALNKNRD
jgi:ribosome biogenesis GTPase / thiamine phosphate phosphatase